MTRELVGELGDNITDHEESLASPLEQAFAQFQHIGRLPPRQRQVLILRFFEDLSTGQTAAVLGISVSAVTSTELLAKRKLYQQIGGSHA